MLTTGEGISKSQKLNDTIHDKPKSVIRTIVNQISNDRH